MEQFLVFINDFIQKFIIQKVDFQDRCFDLPEFLVGNFTSWNVVWYESFIVNLNFQTDTRRELLDEKHIMFQRKEVK